MKKLMIPIIALILAGAVGINLYYNDSGHKNAVIIDLPTLNQSKEGYPRGCESVSLYMAMRSKGYLSNMTVQQFLDTMPTGATPNEGFMGTPTLGKSKENEGCRTTIYPTPLAAWGSKYGNVVSLEGASVDELKKELDQGNPLVVYVTGSWKEPVWGEWPWGKDVNNNHALCLAGYAKNGDYYINDCSGKHNGTYWVDKDTFESIYNARHKAVVVR